MAVIVKLGSGVSVNKVLTFDECFVNYSNAKGKGGGGGGVLKKVAQKVAAPVQKAVAKKAEQKKAEPAKPKGGLLKKAVAKVAAPVKKAAAKVAAAKPLQKVAAKVAAAKPLQKVAAKVQSKVATVKAKQAEKKAAKQAEEIQEEELEEEDPEEVEEEEIEEEPEELEEEEEEEEESADGIKRNNNFKINDMENTVVVKLQPNTNIHRVATFEEAFLGEEHSNLFGKGKAKRLAKKAANKKKIAAAKQSIAKDKAATKIAKQEAKGDVKVAKQNKKARKKVAKVSKRATAQAARVEKRSTAATNRNAIKDFRKTAKVNRKAMGADVEEPELEEEELLEEEVPEEEEYEGEEEGEEEYEEEEPEEEEEEYEEEEPEEEDEEYESEEMFSGHGYFDNFAEDLASFSGQDEMRLEADMSYSFKGPDGSRLTEKIHPKVFEHAKKIEWNKHQVAKLEPIFQNAHPSQRKEIADKITLHKNTAQVLESKLDGYTNLDGRDNDSYAIGKRVAEGHAALREARKLRMKAAISRGKGSAARKSGRSLTEIEQNLNPVIKPGEVTIPARMDSSSADGVVTKVKLVAKKTNWSNVFIGLAIGGAAIYAINKLKLI